MSLKSVPVFHSKISYFSVAKSIHIFANQISNIALLIYPKTSNYQLELQACDAISDSLIFSFDSINYISYVPHLIEIFQVTRDPRASKFLELISKNSSIQYFVNLCRRILINSCLLENSAIEPATHVKLCFLRIVQTLIHLLKEPYNELLGDLITCACRQAKISYKILEEILSLFFLKKNSDGERILDLYDSQFQDAVESAFSSPLKLSVGFLRMYLSFKSFEAIPLYLKELANSKERTSEYFSLATRICIISQEQKFALDVSFVNTLTQSFSNVVIEAMNIRKNSDNWKEMNQFRDSYSSFFPRFIPMLNMDSIDFKRYYST